MQPKKQQSYPKSNRTKIINIALMVAKITNYKRTGKKHELLQIAKRISKSRRASE